MPKTSNPAMPPRATPFTSLLTAAPVNKGGATPVPVGLKSVLLVPGGCVKNVVGKGVSPGKRVVESCGCPPVGTGTGTFVPVGICPPGSLDLSDDAIGG